MAPAADIAVSNREGSPRRFLRRRLALRQFRWEPQTTNAPVVSAAFLEHRPSRQHRLSVSFLYSDSQRQIPSHFPFRLLSDWAWKPRRFATRVLQSVR